MSAFPAKLAGGATLKLEHSADELVCRLLNLDPRLQLALLDSCGESESGGRYLIAGVQPYETITECGGVVTRQFTGRTEAEVLSQTVLDALDHRLREGVGSTKRTKWAGGCIATLSYEFGRRFELPRNRESSVEVEPEAELAFFDALIIHDYSTGESYVAGERPGRLSEIRELVSNSPGDREAKPV
ncbi:MAG: hypothetical protein ABIP75_10405, partial [Pyrinomonadaceae bacterium]